MTLSKGKKLVQINTVCNTSTGKLMGDIQRQAIKEGYETLSIVGRRKCFTDLPCIKIGNPISFWIHVGITTIFDRHGYGSYFATRKIVARLRKENPDIIHLHNLHGYYLHLPTLFHYLSEEFQGKIFWTFHDCWPFTGHCAHFTAVGCEKWEEGCSHCPNKKVYPISLMADSSRINYSEKKEMFCKLKDLTIITPSKWMADNINLSFFKNYTTFVVPNGIDLKLFHPVPVTESIYKKMKIKRDKKILLGVSSVWNERKGLGDFLKLAKVLGENYQIVLVGLSKKQIKNLPDSICGIERTENQKDMAMLYSLAHIFINPSLEESFSLVTAEALACGTPVIVLDTSAVKDFVEDKNGIVLTKHEPEDYIEAIRRIEERNISSEEIIKTAKGYDVNLYGKRVMELYEQM